MLQTATLSLPGPSNEMDLRDKGVYRRPFAQRMMTMYSIVKMKGLLLVQTSNLGAPSHNRVTLEMTWLVDQE